MASDGGGVPNSKQHARPKKPYDRRTSIVRRMRETVKDMMSPSWLVDLVHSVRKPSQPAQSVNNISQPTPASRSETMCSEVRNTHTAFVPINQAPAGISPAPSSRAATFSSDSPRFSHFPTMHLQGSTCMSGQTVYSSTAVYSQPSHEYNQESSNYVQPKGDDQSEMSEYSISTSGCSSLVPHPDQRDYQRDILQLSESKIVQMRQELGGSVTPSKEIDPPTQRRPAALDDQNVSKLTVSNNNKSFLWSSSPQPSRSSRPQPPAKSQRPAFNISIFSSQTQITSTRRQELGKDYQQSPYYPGKTTFGGAAAHRKNRLKHSSPYHSPVTKRQVTARPLNNSTLGGVTSSTAKRILDTLEKMSTPIKDAKKIPSYNSSFVDSSMSFTPTNYRRRSVTTPHQDRSISEPPPVAGLAPPTMARVMRNMQGPTDRQHTPLSHTSSTAPDRGVDQPREGGNDGGVRTGKMRRERGQHYSSKKVGQEEEVELPALPTSFTLPIGSMATINFASNMTPSSTLNTTTSTRMVQLDGGAASSSPLFRFSSPILKEVADSFGGPSSPTYNRSFQFSSPITVDKPATVASTPCSQSPHASPFSSAPFSNTSFSSSPSLAFTYQVDSAKLKKKPIPSPVSSPEPGGFTPAKKLAAGSVMDILSKSASDQATSNRPDDIGAGGSTTSNMSSLFKKPDGSWECPTCMLQNKADKCVACNTSKPSSVSSGDNVMSPPDMMPDSQSLGSLFKTPAGSWECSTCMIRNKADIDRCVACETAKPKTNNTKEAALSGDKVSVPVGGNSLAALFKKPADSWECPTCMVQNLAKHEVCPACSTARPGAPSKTADEPVKLPPLTGPSLASQFTKPAGSWECDTCMVTNKEQSNKCIACDTLRPGTKSTTNFTSPGGFKFGTTGGLVLTSTTSTTDITGATPVFSFGTTSSTNIPAETKDKSMDGGFKFGTSAPANFGSAGGIKLGASSVTTSDSTGFKVSESSSGSPAKSAEGVVKTVPFGGIQFGQSTMPPAGNTSQFGIGASTGGFKFGTVAESSSAAAKTTESVPTSSTAALFGLMDNSTALDSNEVKFDKPAPESAKPSDVTPVTTAPTFGGFMAVSTDSSSTSTQVKPPPVGGFSFGQSASLTPGASDNKTTPKKGGFNFVAATTTAAFTSPASLSSSSAKIGGFSFGGSTKTSDTKSQSGSSVGGFSFGSSTKTSDTKSQSGSSVGGFSFGGSTKTLDTKSQSGSSVGGFSFGASTKTSDMKTVSSGSTVGGFSFGTGVKTSDVKKPENAGTAGGFSFGASAKTSTAEKAVTSSAAMFSPMVMSPATPGGFQFPTTLTSSAASSTGQSDSVFGSVATSATSKPPTGGFSFGASTTTSVPSSNTETSATPSNFVFAGTAAGAAGTDAGFAFRKRASGDDDVTSKRIKGSSVFGAANTSASAPAGATPFAGGFGSTTAVFGATTPNSAATTFNTPAFGATSTNPTGGFMFAAQPAPTGFGAPQPGTKTTAFQFSAPTTTSTFTFGSSQPAQSTSAPKPSGGFPFGGQSQPIALGLGAPAPQQSAPSFNFNSTPNINFGASQQTNPAAPFQFGAQPSATPGASNSFSMNRASGGVNNRRIKKAVRKIKK